jgi:hypothetical protein
MIEANILALCWTSWGRTWKTSPLQEWRLNRVLRDVMGTQLERLKMNRELMVCIVFLTQCRVAPFWHLNNNCVVYTKACQVLSSAPCYDFTQRLIVCSQSFRTTYRSCVPTVKQSERSPWNAWPLKMWKMGCPKTSVTKYRMLLKIPEDWRSNWHCGWSLTRRILSTKFVLCIRFGKGSFCTMVI